MSKVIDGLPVEHDFYMPGEHAPQEQVWMAWPVRSDNWRNGAKPAQKAFVDVARVIAEETQVVMLVSQSQYKNAREQLPSHIRVIEMSYNDCWMRDMGATCLIHQTQELRRGISWNFNAWGGLVDGLYFPWDLDDLVAEKMLNLMGDDIYDIPMVLEGGSIHTDGEGTLFTTEECLLHPSRNPDMSKQEIENRLKSVLGINKVIWLPNGLYNDETNGHVDNIMHVVKPGEVILTCCDDPNDPQYRISQKALDVLSSETDAKGRTIKVHKIPMPGPLYITEEEAEGVDSSDGMERHAGERLGASYSNFLVTNNLVVYPLLDEHCDEQAKEVLECAFPEHQVVGVKAREILLGGGNIHCITQQIPKVKAG
ncbi:agmatine deiminase [Vibrio salinus]|uniref:agmatine deiminase n=1 Tax=Vibrio salinus TaxID=2899784 RepID=UPI001E4D3025|nr:agmatine deiminase [Vibrio salinus]MCE0493362.1 agmatine deiminase [Vibrio salinus]